MSTLSLEFSIHFNLTLHYSIKTKKPPLYIYTPSSLSLSLSNKSEKPSSYKPQFSLSQSQSLCDTNSYTRAT